MKWISVEKLSSTRGVLNNLDLFSNYSPTDYHVDKISYLVLFAEVFLKCLKVLLTH